MPSSITDEDDTPRRPHDDIPDGEQQSRIDRAKQDGARSTIDRDSRPEDIMAAFGKHGGVTLPWIEDAYRINGRTVLSESNLADPTVVDWYVLQCRPGGERQAVKGLTELAYDQWLPKQKLWRQVRAPKKGQPKKVGVELPLIVGYAFLPHMRATIPNWPRIEGVDGVSGVLRHDGSPQPVLRLALLLELRRLEAEGHFDETRDRPPKTKRGDTVMVSEGPLAGLKGLVEIATRERVKVMLGSLFGQVDISVDSVDVVG